MRPSFDVIKAMGLKNGVELGVYFGANAARVLYGIPDCNLLLVDSSETVLNIAKENLKEFADRFRFLVSDSSAAASFFLNGGFDFVYIDADHTYNSVTKDIMVWYPKVRKGGVLAGHDYQMGGGKTQNNEDERVKDAVDECTQALGLKLFTGKTDDDNANYDWWVIC